MKRIITSLLLFVLLCSCENLIIVEDEMNTPNNNFELLWNDFDQNYGLFEIRNINWDSLYTAYRPLINDQMTDQELWTTVTELLEELDDGHTSINNEVESFISGYEFNGKSKLEYSRNLITDKYLEWRIDVESEENLSYGKIKEKDIGYIYLGQEGGRQPDVIADIIEELEDHKAIIFDIRQNVGGSDKYAHRMAGAFADDTYFAYTSETRNGPNHDDFGVKIEFFTTPIGDFQYTKPVMVLTDRRTISAGEVFLIHMKNLPHVEQIGDITAGDFSTTSISRFLPNGWTYNYSIQKFLLPDGTSLDGIGHIPDVYLKNTKEDIEQGNDIVLEGSFIHLLDKYGIE